MKRINRELRRAIERRTKIKTFPATIVSSGKRVPFAKVKFSNGSEMEVINLRMSNVAGLKVRIGYDPTMPGVLQVLGIREIIGTEGVGGSWKYWLPDHHRNHEYPGHDTVWVDAAQIMPLNVLPLGGFTLRVYGAAVRGNGTWAFAQAQEVNLTSSKPSAGARYTLLELDENGTLVVTDGTVQAARANLSQADIPEPTLGRTQVAAIMLYDSQTKIQRDTNQGKRNDVVDLRWGGFATGGGSHGIPAGGVGGQILSKKTASDYDMEWIDPAIGGSGAGDIAFGVEGFLAVATSAGAQYLVTRDLSIAVWYIACESIGSAGSTIIDVNKNGTTVFTTQANRPTLVYDNANGWAVSGTADISNFVEGDIITVDIDQVADGAEDLVVVGKVGSGGATGSLAVSELDGDPSVSNVTEITFEGATVTNEGGGKAKVSITGSGASVADLGSSAETVGGSASNGTALTAARSDHKHAITNPKLDDLNTPDNNTDLNASTSAHGLMLKAVAPASGIRNAVVIDNGETDYKNAALFDNSNPAGLGTSAAGTQLVAARRDHVHAMPTAADVGALDASALDDTAYGSEWDGDTTHVPTRNAVYDIIETVRSLIFHLQQSLSSLRAIVSSLVSGVAYGASWGSDSQHAPSKQAVYDKIESLAPASVLDDSAYGPGWDGDTTHAPTRNAVYDKIETMGSGVPSVSNNIIEIQVFS
jgi:hypothetical protein